MKKSMFKLLSFATVFLSTVNASGQISWPTAFDLSTANYQMQGWSPTSTAVTYPASMQFYFLATTSDPSAADTIGEVYAASYNVLSGTRLTGQDNNGFSFINTGSSNLSSNGYKLGAAVLALNTTNRDSIRVSWTGRTITPNNRIYDIQLFYRVGDTGAFSPVLDATNNPVFYERSATAGDSVVYSSILLPDTTFDQPLVQLQWKYYQSTANGTTTGPRAELAISSILVTSVGSPLPPAAVVTTSTNTLSAFNTPVGMSSASETFDVYGENLTDTLWVQAASPFEVSTDGINYSASLDLIPVSGIVDTTQIYVRFSPTTPGTQNGVITISTQTVSVSGYAYASSNPVAAIINNADFQFLAWDSTASAGTYPSNMVFHVSDNNSPELIYAPLPDNWHCGYDLTSRPRFNGLGNDGISFLNTGSAQYDDCTSGSNSNNTFIGGIVAAVNTQNIDSASMEFDVELLLRDTTSSTPREYALRLQVRTDTTADFADINPLQEFSSVGNDINDQTHFSFNLPLSLIGMEYVEFRWLYYDLNIQGASGSRPKFRLDNVEIKKLTGDVNAVQELMLNNQKIKIYPNPIENGMQLHFSEAFSGKLCDMTGREILSFENTNSINIQGIQSGMYIIRAQDGSEARISVL